MIAHAALGCAAGAIASGDCKAGAVGGVVGELTAELFANDLKAALAKGDLGREEAVEMIGRWQGAGIDVARVAAGLGAALAGGDVDTGADAGGSAAANNAFWFLAIPIIVAALETLDKVLIAKDAVEISVAAYECNAGSQAACNQATEMAKQAAKDAGIELTIGSVVPGSKAATDLLRWVRKNADADTVRKIDKATNASGAANANAQDALAAKLSGLQKAQETAAVTKTLPDGRIRYYTQEVPARTEGQTRGASFVTEYDPSTGSVRQWMESYNQSGQVIRVHPKSINGQPVDAQHYPPTGAELKSWE